MKTNNFNLNSLLACDSLRQSPDGRPTVGRQSSVNQMAAVSQPSVGRLSFTNALRNLCVSFAHRSRLVATLLLLVTMSVGQVWGRSFDGTTYLYFNANPSSCTWWWDSTPTQYVWFKGSTETSKLTATSIDGSIHRILVPAGNWTTMKIQRGTWNLTGYISIDATKNYLSNGIAENATSGTWDNYVLPQERVLNGTDVMFYYGSPESWGTDKTLYFRSSNQTNSTLLSSKGTTSYKSGMYLAIGCYNLNSSTTYYLSNSDSWGGNSKSGLRAGCMADMSGDVTSATGGCTFTTTNYSISEGDASVSFSTSVSGNSGIGSNWGSIAYYYKPNSTWEEFDPNNVSSLAVGTYTIYALVSDGHIVVRSTNSATLTVSSAATYTLTVVKGANIASVSGGKADQTSVPFNSNISATPETGYDFAGWTADPAANAQFTNAENASTTVTVKNGSVTVTASAREHMNTITIVGGTAASTTAGIATKGTATAAEPAGKRFTSWTVPGSNFTLSGCLATDKTITFNATAAGTVTANYTDISYCRLYYSNPENWSDVYVHIWKDGGSTLTTWPGKNITSQFEPINGTKYYYVEIDRDAGYNRIIFHKKDGDQTGNIVFSNENCDQYNNANKNQLGSWQALPEQESLYTVSVVAGENGTVSPSSVEANSTTHPTITATPASHYAFDNWAVDGGASVASSSAASTTVTATAAGTVTANFKPSWDLRGAFNGWSGTANQFTVYDGDVSTTNVNLTAGNTYSFKIHHTISGSSSEWYGNTGTMTRGHSTGWTMSKDVNDECKITADVTGTYVFTFNASTKKLSVTYPSEQTFAVNFVAGANGSVEPEGEQQVGAITPVAIGATADAHYYFNNWTTEGSAVVANADAASTTVTATEAGTVTANFLPSWSVRGTFNGWATGNYIEHFDGNTGYVDIVLEADRTYEFKVYHHGDSEYSYNGDHKTMTREDCTDWTLYTDNNNSKITADVAGTYRFTFNADTKKLTVTYPAKDCKEPTIDWDTAPADGNEGGNMTASVNTNDPSAEVTWTSSNEAVATVVDGVITYKSAGTTTITASYTGSGEYCATEKSVSKTITVSAASIIYAYLNVQYQVGNDWNSNDENVEILDGKLTGKTLGEYTVTRGGAPVTVRVYQYYIKHPWNSGDADNGKWVWKAMTIKNGKPTYTGAAGDAGANIAWSIENKDGEIGSIDGNVWKAGIEYTPRYTKGNMYDFVYDPGQALNGAIAPTTGGTLTANESNIRKTTITFAAQTFTIAGAAGSDGGAVKSTAGVSGSAIAQGKQVTFTAEAAAGYTFEGWYSEEACTNKVSDKAEYTATMPEAAADNTYAIYAKFQQKVTMSVKIGSGVYVAMTDKGNGSFEYSYTETTATDYNFTVKVGNTDKTQGDSYTVTVNSKVTITAVYNGYNESMTINVVVEPTGEVETEWYLVGGPFGGNYNMSNMDYPANKLYRATAGVYYREVSMPDGLTYFRVNHNGEALFGFCNNGENRDIKEGYNSAETLNYCADVRSNLTYNKQEVINVIIDTRAVGETNTVKVWFEKTLPTCHSVLVTNGAGGIYTLKTASGFATTQMAEGEGYKLTITPEAGRRPIVTVDGKEVALTNNGDGTFTYSGTMVKENQNVVISYTEPQDITIKMHVNCIYWQDHNIYAQYENESGSWTQVKGTPATKLAGYTNWVTYTFSKDAFTGGLVQFTTNFNSTSNNDWSDQIKLTQFDDSYCYELTCDIAGEGRKLVKTDCPTLGVELVVKNADKIGGTAALSSILSATGAATYAYYLSKNGADYYKLAETETAEYSVKEAGTYQYKVVVALNGETAEAESEVITVAQPKLSIQPSSSAVGTTVPVTLTPTIEGIASGASMYLCFTITKGGEAQSITVDNTDGYKVTFNETGEYTIHTELKLGTDCSGEALASTENVITVGAMTIEMTSNDYAPVIGSNITLTTTVNGAGAAIISNYYVTVKSSTEPMPKQVYNGSEDHFDFTVASEETYTFRATVTIGGQEYEASTVVTAQAKDVYINYPWDGTAMPADGDKIKMNYAGDGVYTYYKAGESMFQCGTDMEVTADGVTIAKGTIVTFTYNPSTDKLSFVQGGNVAPTVGPTEDGNPSGADWYLKHPWNGGNWQYVGMKRNDDGTYSVSGAWGNDGVDVRRGSDGGQWHKSKNNIYTQGTFAGAYIYKPSKTVIETPILIDLTDENCGTDAIFSYNINRNELTIMRASSTLNRVKVTTGGETYYSNEISEDGELSFFANQSATLTWEQFGNGSTTWTEVTDLTNPVTHGGIYVADATISSHDISNVTEYTGTYYIYSHLTGLDEETIDTYAVTGKDGAGQFKASMTKFEVVDPERQFYNHYWVEWVNKDRDAYATVGNKINRNLSKVLPSYTLPVGTNLRYAYNPKDNYFSRMFLEGSTSDRKFLQLYGTNVFDKATGNTALDNSTATASSRATFSDGSKWEYPVEVRCLAPSQMKIIANYNGQVTYLLDKNGLSVTTRPMLQESSLESKLVFEVVYDYKTNLITLGWVPEPEVELTENNVIKSDIIIRRVEDQDPTLINLGTGATVSGLMKATAELEINRNSVFSSEGVWASDAKRMYWFSLPYDCAIKDIYGIDGYGTKWYIEEYRGDLRAKSGWVDRVPTFWAIKRINQTLKANVGYVIVLDQLSWDDFKTIGSISKLRLYFPSTEKGFHLENNVELNTTVPSYICNITSPVDRRQDDSNWNIIGVPGFMNAKVNKSFEYFYTWNSVDDYDESDTDEVTFAPTKAFMVQYAGLVSWSTKADVQQTGAPVRVKAEDKRSGKYCLKLKDAAGKEDKTFITLSEDGTDDYIMGKDMSKIFNSKKSLIFTQMKDRDFMANDVCDTTTRVAISTLFLEDAEYTISLREGDAWVQTPFLYDAELNTYTDLSISDYSFVGLKGEDNKRFSLVLGYKAPEIVTSVEGVAKEDKNENAIEKVMMNGILYILRDGKLYDAMGKTVK